MRTVAHGSEGVSLTKGIHFRLTDAHGKVSAAGYACAGSPVWRWRIPEVMLRGMKAAIEPSMKYESAIVAHGRQQLSIAIISKVTCTYYPIVNEAKN